MNCKIITHFVILLFTMLELFSKRALTDKKVFTFSNSSKHLQSLVLQQKPYGQKHLNSFTCTKH